MTDHIAKRNETVLDVVINLASEVSDGCAPFGIAHACRAFPQTGREVTQKARKRPDFIGTSTEAHVEPIQIKNGRLRGKTGERFTDP